MVEYAILNVPLLGRNLAASRSPRLQPSVSEEYGDMLSNEVARGDWTVDPENGQPLNSKGQTIADHLEFTLKTRPHWLLPVVLEDEADAVWTSGNLTKQGERLRQLEKFCGSKAAALVMLNEEAERYGVKPFTTQIGTKPGASGEKKSGDEGNATTNPWSKNFRGDEAARAARINSIIKTGTKFADALARAAGRVRNDVGLRWTFAPPPPPRIHLEENHICNQGCFASPVCHGENDEISLFKLRITADSHPIGHKA